MSEIEIWNSADVDNVDRNNQYDDHIAEAMSKIPIKKSASKSGRLFIKVELF